MTDWQGMVRAICTRMTRDQAAEELDCHRSTVDQYLAGKLKQPYADLADRIRALHERITQSTVL
jgi:hypothetical protein